MRYLIDGYNVMYAGGLLGKRLGPRGFHRVRTRFLNDLADRLGPVDAHRTTVVFDASNSPEDAVAQTSHKGLSIIYAVDDENADARIERLIAAHSAPKGLTVVSSDNRVRQAAGRRRARALSADEFWMMLDAMKSRRSNPLAPRSASTSVEPEPEPEKPTRTTEDESAHWLREFGHLDHQPETREALGNHDALLTDEEIAQIEREIERDSS